MKDGSEKRRIRRITKKANGVCVNKKKGVREEYKEEGARLNSDTAATQ